MERVSMKILAFGHQKRVGKDTAAGFAMTYIRSNNKVRNARKAGFADQLKKVCHDIYGWAGLQSGPYYEEPGNGYLKEVILPRLGKTPRQIWISFGNEVKNAAHPDTWLDFLLENVRCDFLVITDMRFPNEADRIKSLGGRVVKLVRPTVQHTSDAADDPLLDYTRWDDIVVNDTDLGGLYKKVTTLVEGILCETGSFTR
jgi:hypothetical protein